MRKTTNGAKTDNQIFFLFIGVLITLILSIALFLLPKPFLVAILVISLVALYKMLEYMEENITKKRVSPLTKRRITALSTLKNKSEAKKVIFDILNGGGFSEIRLEDLKNRTHITGIKYPFDAKGFFDYNKKYLKVSFAPLWGANKEVSNEMDAISKKLKKNKFYQIKVLK